MAGEDPHGRDGPRVGEATPRLVNAKSEPGDLHTTETQGPSRLERLVPRRLPLGSGRWGGTWEDEVKSTVHLGRRVLEVGEGRKHFFGDRCGGCGVRGTPGSSRRAGYSSEGQGHRPGGSHSAPPAAGPAAWQPGAPGAGDHPPPDILMGPELRLHFAGPLSSRGRPSRLQARQQPLSPPHGPYQEGRAAARPRTLPPDCADGSALSLKFRTAQ